MPKYAPVIPVRSPRDTATHVKSSKMYQASLHHREGKEHMLARRVSRGVHSKR